MMPTMAELSFNLNFSPEFLSGWGSWFQRQVGSVIGDDAEEDDGV